MAWQIGRQRSFLGGEVQASLPELVARDEMLRMENVIINENGTISESMRMDEVLITGATNGLAIVRLPAGTYDTYWTSGNNIYVNNFSTLSDGSINAASGTQSGCTGGYIKGIQEAVPFLGKHYVANPNPDQGYNGVLNLTDKTISLIAAKTTLKLRKYMNRLWVVNSDGTIQLSNNGDASIFDELNILWLPNQEPAIDFIPMQGGAIVYSQHSIFAMYGSDYTDISFTLILTNQKLSSGAVMVDNTVYIPSVRGIIRTTLNTADLIPHKQETYFKANYGILSKQAFASDVVVGCYLQRLKAVLFTWSTAQGGTQSIIYYTKGGYSKLTYLLPTAYPFILALNDTYIDGLVGLSSGTIAKYRASTAPATRAATIQTRHEDCDSPKDKVWRCFTLEMAQATSKVKIDVFLDEATVATPITNAVTLVKGENHFWMDIPRSKTISFLITIVTGNFCIKEMRLKYREVGNTI